MSHVVLGHEVLQLCYTEMNNWHSKLTENDYTATSSLSFHPSLATYIMRKNTQPWLSFILTFYYGKLQTYIK